MLDPATSDTIARALGAPPHNLHPLSGGCVAEVYRADIAGDPVVIKVDQSRRPSLDIEARMLAYLAERSSLPVPRVLHAEPALLIMTWIDGRSACDPGAQRHAAELLADLHGISAPTPTSFGLDFDTLIGALPQPNTATASWPDFFATFRLREMARQARGAGRLPDRPHARIQRAADRCHQWLAHDPQPSLIHGDIWGGNILATPGRIAGFSDPAIYYADAEVELAFIALFSTFDAPFWDRYHELRPIDPAFFQRRRDLYNLYPLLVHVRLFGAGYLAQLEATLDRLGV